MVLSISAEGSSRARDNGLVSMGRSLLYSCLKEKETSVFHSVGEMLLRRRFLPNWGYGAIPGLGRRIHLSHVFMSPLHGFPS